MSPLFYFLYCNCDDIVLDVVCTFFLEWRFVSHSLPVSSSLIGRGGAGGRQVEREGCSQHQEHQETLPDTL